MNINDIANRYADLSEVEQIRLRRIIDLHDEANEELRGINTAAKDLAWKDLGEASAAYASVKESARDALERNITTAAYELDNITTAGRNQIDIDIERAVNHIVESGQSPTMSYAERIYYETLPKSDAYNITQMSNVASRSNIDIDNQVQQFTQPVSVSPDLPAGIGEDAIDIAADIKPVVPPPIILPPPTIPVNPLPPMLGFKTCYLVIDNADGSKSSIPIQFPDNGKGCPEGYSNIPVNTPAPTVVAVPPPSPPTSTFVEFIGPNDDETTRIEQFGNKCNSSGGLVSIDKFANSWKLTCTIQPPPIAAPDAKCKEENTHWDIQRQECVQTIRENTGSCLPLMDAIYSNPTYDSKDKSSTPCPPDCVKIDSIIGNQMVPPMPCHWWDDIEKCKYASGASSIVAVGSGSGTESSGLPSTVQGVVNNPGLAGFIATFASGPLNFLPSVFGSLLSGNPGKNIIMDAVGSLMTAGFAATNKIASKRAEDCKSSTATILDNLAQLGIAGWGEVLSQAPVSYVFTDAKYALQYEMPQFIPTQSEFDIMYLSAQINDEQWECYTKANGNLPRTHQKSRDAKRTRIEPRQAIFLNRYGKLPEDKYVSIMRSLGFIDTDERKQFEDSIANLPGISDIIRFMVRDSADEAVVEKYSYDEDFDKKYTGLLKTWAKSQGIPDDAAKFAWRAHWELISNTVVNELVRRNRPGRVDEKLVFTKQDALDLYGINDIAPGLREMLLSVSYSVMTRTDVKRGFLIESLEEDEVKEALLDNGYIQRDVDIIYKIFEQEKILYDQGIAARRSAFTPKQIANLIADGSMTIIEAKQELVKLKLNDAAIERIINSGQNKAKAISRRACLKAVKRRFFSGQLSSVDAFAELQNYGLDAGAFAAIFDAWECEYAARSKDLSASKNVNLFLQGIIQIDELARRLRNLNYTEQAVSGWLSGALVKQRENMEKAADKAARDAERERARQQRDLDRVNKLRRQAMLDAQRQQSPIPRNSPAIGDSP